MWANRKENGYYMLEETKQKLRNKVVTDEARRNMSLAQKKRLSENPISHSQDTKKKISDKTKAMWADPVKAEERRQKLRDAWARRKELAKLQKSV